MIMFDNRIGVISEVRQKRKDMLIELLSADAEEISDDVDVRTEYFENSTWTNSFIISTTTVLSQKKSPTKLSNIIRRRPNMRITKPSKTRLRYGVRTLD